MDFDKVKAEAKGMLSRGEIKCIIGYEKGTYGFRISPSFAFTPEDVDKFILTPLCANNLVTYLKLERRPPLPQGVKPDNRKVALFVKGCDSRAILQLIAEKNLSRDDVFIFGVPCAGRIDLRKVENMFPHIRKADVVEKNEDFAVIIEGREHLIPREKLIFDRCKSCEHPNPLIYDLLIGGEISGGKTHYNDVAELEKKTIDERWNYWRAHFKRCIRCNACRDICPICYCEDCILERLKPQWLNRSVNVNDNAVYHLTRAYHVAGRCISCGECERACPMHLPLMKLYRKLEKDIKELFDYTPGLTMEEKHLLTTFKPEDSEEFIR